MMKTIITPAIVLLALALSGCGSNATENSRNTNAGPASPTPVVVNTGQPTGTPPATNSLVSNDSAEDQTPDDTSDFAGTAGITDKRNVNIKAPGFMSAVRTARHGNYDRVVFEFSGPELPGYHVEYIDKPVRGCGSGNVIPLAGDGWLEVRFTDAQAHTNEGQPTIADREQSPNLPIIKELKISCDFEGEVTWVLGVASPNKYRVLELTDPTRLAVDIKH